MAGKRRSKDDELGSESAGQSGDIQQMPNAAEADSESVEELAEEGNAFEPTLFWGWKTPRILTFLR